MSDTAAQILNLQKKLIAELQEEYFCDDVKPPREAFGWSEEKIRAFFESPEIPVDASVPAARAGTLAPADGQPVLLMLGDSLTQMSFDMGASSPPAMPLVAEQAGPVNEGPGWGALLSRTHTCPRIHMTNPRLTHSMPDSPFPCTRAYLPASPRDASSCRRLCNNTDGRCVQSWFRRVHVSPRPRGH
jgi:hypothetical protein